MRLLIGIAAGVAACTAAFAQENAAIKAQQVEIHDMLRGAKVIGIEGAIMGPAVKGEPYTADEVHETTQTLADGTRIHNETKTTVSRDSQGRVRRESPGQVMIWDAAAGTSYMLNQSSQTGQKMQVGFMVRKPLAPGEAPDLPLRLFTRPDDPSGKTDVFQHQIMVLRDQDPKSIAEAKAGGWVAAAGPVEAKAQAKAMTPQKDVKKDLMGSQVIEGVTCDGVRLTSTIEAGAIGNDRPIQITEERWTSPELKVDLMVRKSDPRTGEDVVRLTNVRRIEPDPGLFTVPPGYQIK